MKKITLLLPILVGYLLSTVPCHAYRDLETGVFLSRDPAGQVDGPNVYTYVRQNPWTMFDPLGLFTGFEFATQHMTAKQEVEVFTQTAKALPVAVAATVAVIATRGAILKHAPRIGGALMRPAGMAIATDAAVTVSETVSGIEGPGAIPNLGDAVRVPAQAMIRNADEIVEVVGDSARATKEVMSDVVDEIFRVQHATSEQRAIQYMEKKEITSSSEWVYGVESKTPGKVTGTQKEIMDQTAAKHADKVIEFDVAKSEVKRDQMGDVILPSPVNIEKRNPTVIDVPKE